MIYKERNNRIDNQGRVLRNNEFQNADGRYKFRWRENGELKTYYSWKLEDEDSVPQGKKCNLSIREFEKKLFDNGGKFQKEIDREDITLDNRFWLNMESRKLQDRTRKNYEWVYKKFIKPALGSKNIKKIDYNKMLVFVLKLLNEDGFNPRGVEQICNILRPVFKDAMVCGLILRNPMDGIMIEVRKDSRWTTRIYSERKSFKPYVYRYIDKKTGEIKYIGIVYCGSFKKRIQRHAAKDVWANDSEWKIQYFQVETRSEAEAIESHLIAVHKTYLFYNTAKCNWGINSYLPDFEEKWIDYIEELHN